VQPTRTTCRQAATARLIMRRDPQAVLALGDTQYPRGRFSDYQASYDHDWGDFRGKTLPVTGNHEYLTSQARGYYRYFGARAHGPRGWYAVNRGSWRIYVLNTNCGAVSCAAEKRWLAHDLRTHPHRCSLAAMHHPRFSSGPHGPSADARRFWPTMDGHQLDLALAGHDHVYERFARMHADGTIARSGIRSFVVGTGGAELYDLGPATHGSQFRYKGFGVLFLTLEQGKYSWTFRTTTGFVRDHGSARCIH
jgi:acid phosphatase type 7